MLKIHYDDEKLLHEKLQPCNVPYEKEDIDLALAMHEYVRLSQDDEYAKKNKIRPGIGLAASQVGSNKRILSIFMYDEKEKLHSYALLNPTVISRSAKQCYLENGEGCLSVKKDWHGYVYRSYKIVVKAFNCITMKEEKISLTGYAAICMQHELDHLEGILYYDHIDKLDPYRKNDDAIAI